MSLAKQGPSHPSADRRPASAPDAAAELLTVGMVVAGADGSAVYANAHWAAITGQDGDGWAGQGWFRAIAEGDRVAAQAELLAAVGSGDRYDADWRLARSAVGTRIIHVSALPQLSGERVTGMVATAVDVTAERDDVERLSHRAVHDPLTGLYNREQFLEFVGHALDRQRREPERLAAVLFVDIDGLRDVNDRLGHAAGDRLLRAAAARITAAVRPADVVARYGGDEFTVLCEDVSDAHEAQAIAGRLRAAAVDGPSGDGPISVSIGAALANDPDRSPAAVVDQADRARYRTTRAMRRRALSSSADRSAPVPPPIRAVGDPESVLAAAAHEMRSPLTVIAGYASLLRNGRGRMSDDEVESAFAVLERQCAGLVGLLDDLLELGARHNDVAPVVVPVPLDAVIGDALEIAPAPAGKNVSTDGSRPPPVVLAERRSLARVVVNLLTNAYRYGGPNVIVSWVEHVGEVVLAVEDDGAGVPDGMIETLFRPFSFGRSQAAAAPTPGRGLGLALSREIVESTGGRIEYVPRLHRGARFVVTFPAGQNGRP